MTRERGTTLTIRHNGREYSITPIIREYSGVDAVEVNGKEYQRGYSRTFLKYWRLYNAFRLGEVR